MVMLNRPYVDGQDGRPQAITPQQMAMGMPKFSTRMEAMSAHMTATASFQVPSYLYYMRKYGYEPSDELRAMNKAEWAEMVARFNQVLQQEIAANDGETKVHYIRV